MKSQPEEDLQRRLSQLETEIYSSESGVSSSNSVIEKISSSFNRLSRTGKLIVVGVAVLCGIAILQIVFKLIAAVISLAILGLVVYVGYKFLVSNRS